MALGLKMYDALAGKDGLGDTEFLNRAETLAHLPTLQPQGLQGRRQVLGRPVRRRAAGAGAGPNRCPAGCAAGQLLRRHRADP